VRLEVNGIEIDVHVEGPEDAPVMVVHHGGPGVSSAAAIDGGWSPLASLVRLVTFDARGSGRSPTVPPYSHEQWTADVDAIRQHLGVDRIIMAGHSYGGFVSLEYTSPR
jgi:proline iminopeptidase